VEIRVEVTTLLGRDDHPAEMPGWGYVHAELARILVREQTDAEWRYAITDEMGRLLFEGITRRRPDGYSPRADASARGGIVELQIKLSMLRRLAARPGGLGVWAQPIADLARQADRHQQDDLDRADAGVTDRQDTSSDRQDSESGNKRGGRSPGKVMRRRTQIRDRTCTHPGCRTPASGTDGDHTRDWAQGGATNDQNIGSLCRHDHRLKHVGGWRVAQPAPGHFVWTSRLGRGYDVRPPLIIQPLPNPMPRTLPTLHYPSLRHDPDDDDAAPTWREPSKRAPAPEPPPKTDLAEEIPSF
jgi:hypothetical protein